MEDKSSGDPASDWLEEEPLAALLAEAPLLAEELPASPLLPDDPAD